MGNFPLFPVGKKQREKMNLLGKLLPQRKYPWTVDYRSLTVTLLPLNWQDKGRIKAGYWHYKGT